MFAKNKQKVFYFQKAAAKLCLDLYEETKDARALEKLFGRKSDTNQEMDDDKKCEMIFATMAGELCKPKNENDKKPGQKPDEDKNAREILLKALLGLKK